MDDVPWNWEYVYSSTTQGDPHIRMHYDMIKKNSAFVSSLKTLQDHADRVKEAYKTDALRDRLKVEFGG